MRRAIFKAAIALEAASTESQRWVYRKPRKQLLQLWKAGGLETKQQHAKAAFSTFLDELKENIAYLPSDKVPFYLKNVKHILCKRQRFHEGILAEQRIRLIQLEEKSQQLSDGTSYQVLAWQEIHTRLTKEVVWGQEDGEVCEKGEDCNGCKVCNGWYTSVFVDVTERSTIQAYYTIAIGTTAYWLAGLEEVKRLQSVSPSTRRRTTRRKISTTEATIWKGILTSDFTINDLNHTLVQIGVIRDVHSLALTSWANRGCWTGVFKALVELRKIPEINNRTKLFKAIIFQYGERATGPSTMRAYNPENKHSLYAHDVVIDLFVREALKKNL